MKVEGAMMHPLEVRITISALPSIKKKKRHYKKQIEIPVIGTV